MEVEEDDGEEYNGEKEELQPRGEARRRERPRDRS